MKSGTVVYISNEKIFVVTAEVKGSIVKVSDCFQLPLAEGTMLNGVIIDEYGLKNSLNELSEHGIDKVHLVVDSAKILAKTAVVPKMKEKEIIQFVKDELSNVDDNSEDVVFDFAYLGPNEEVKGSHKILCVGVERKFIESYLEVFHECHIEILSIDYAINVLISLVKELSGFIDKTYAICQIDGQNMISVVFINNEYALTNRTRLFANRGTSDYESEILNAVSHLKQFASSSQHDQPLLNIYFFGLNQDEEHSLFEKIYTTLDLITNRLPKSKAIYMEGKDGYFDVNEYVYCIGSYKRK